MDLEKVTLHVLFLFNRYSLLLNWQAIMVWVYTWACLIVLSSIKQSSFPLLRFN